MTRVECQQCGHEFDTDREAKVDHATTERCPQCGREADPEADAVDASGTPGVSVTTGDGDGEARVRIDVHLHIHTPGQSG